ncbi:MAG TPA: 5'-3' exonuclease H3TH domain-containing protein, partial [Polyangiaceae bacterium]|nr:5'-3' exonuclease H3TH domain-containing protein [Polyangiaceae bacterium]
SPDKDLMQCVRGTRVVTWDRMRDVRYDEAGVIAKMGVPPLSIPDYLALVGDTADGIPGVPTWGARGSSALLAHYGHLEAIPRESTEWVPKVRGAANMARELVSVGDDVYLYRTLATLRRDVPLDLSASQLEWQGVREDAVAELAQLWGEPRLLELVSDAAVVGSKR